MAQTLLCSGDIHWAGGKVYEHKTEFPIEQAKAVMVNEQVAIAKRQGITDDASLDEVRAIAAEDCDREIARLVSINSLKKPEDMLPASDLAAQLRATQERLAELEARQLAEAGIPSSIASNTVAANKSRRGPAAVETTPEVPAE